MQKLKLKINFRVITKTNFVITKNFGYASVRPFQYFDHFPYYFELFISTFLEISTSNWSRTTGRRTVLVEVKFRQKDRTKVGRSKFGGPKYRKGRRYENGRSTENFKLMRTKHFCFHNFRNF